MSLERLAELAAEHEIDTLVHPSVHVAADLETRIPPALVLDLLQIVREALVDSTKNADASWVQITGQEDPGSVALRITVRLNCIDT